MHSESSKYAGKTVRLKASAMHFQVPDFGGAEVRIDDWWDKGTGKLWRRSSREGNAAAVIYAVRTEANRLPRDDEVLYCKLNGLGHIIHVCEIEGEPDYTPDELQKLVDKVGGRGEMLLLYTLFHFEELIDKGLLDGPRALAESGKEIVRQAIALGFAPDQDEFAAYASYFAERGLTDVIRIMESMPRQN